MANTTTPAGRTGGRMDASATTTSDGADLAFSLPSRLRVHALAKLLSVSSKEVMGALAELGIAVRGAQSSIDRETALRALQVLLPDPEPDLTEIDEVAQQSVPETPLVPVLNSPARPPVLDSPARPLVLNSPAPVFLPPAPQPTAADESNVGDHRDEVGEDEPSADEAEIDGTTRRRRRRGRRGRGRGKAGGDAEDGSIVPGDSGVHSEQDESDSSDESTEDRATDDRATEEPNGSVARRRRRRRRRDGSDDDAVLGEDDPPDTVVHVRESKGHPLVEDEVQSIRGSTRLEAKRQRRRDGREAGRRRVAILSESEFLARREAVERTMVVRERPERTQIGVLEDDILVEHFVTTSGSGSLVGNVYLGKVQNVLPSMEAAFVDIGRGRNAVLYAGEVDWDAAGLEGKARRIEQALSSGDSVLVQVTKDPVGHKGARLTTQVSLPGRFLVYVPGGRATGISRKLPDTERKRLKEVLKWIVPEDAGVIIRTASEGVSEEELARDVGRLQAQWEVIQNRSGAATNSSGGKVTAPELLYEEPDLLVKVVRDLFTEDFRELVVQGDRAWDTVEGYVKHVAPELMSRVRRYVGVDDVFAEFRIDEQITKALDRKVWLPSGGYLIIDRTEAMTVIDVNTGKFTGSGGNLEETVTRNNLEAAEEIIRQLRLRDIGGIIVIDFIDMVLESNRDLVLRRLTECLGRDRTRHQVAEVTSLGLVQMTRKRVGTGLLEAYSSTCEYCRGRGVVVSAEPVNVRSQAAPVLSEASSETLSVPRDSGNVNGRRSKPRGRGSQGAPAASEQTIAQGLTAEGVAPLPAPADGPQSTSAPDGAAPAESVSAEQQVSPPTDDAPSVPAQPPTRTLTRRRRAASRPAGPPATELPEGVDSAAPVLRGTAHEMSTPV
ncbi:MAG: translation initiation factor IF-2 N-terminal domain-containing protein [Pseudonocardiales bacterium]|nr:translation initiation factor IF-2 N-terminal domain-containing protein [Pseudonocardiales bacterium]MBV9727963.1 translation initiation factor IF-2 N-terminal domain-containing protein [Pseudonocardiales bacterium]